ncbi:MAG: PD40 domain-containing protein [Flavobacteriales bacterium]|nr:PD40 domain-containing protein [Flavobacteriales bacterium]
MRYLIIAIFWMFATTAYTQENSKDFKKPFNFANKQYEIGNYYGALKLYDLIYNQDPENKELNFNMGVCNYNIKNYKKAEEHFLKSSSAISLELFRYKASIAHVSMKFKKALNYYNAYKIISGDKDLTNEEINHLVLKTKYAQTAILDKRNVLIQNMGETINTEHQEYVPLISADEKMMLFTSRRPGSTGGKLDPNGRPFEDIYITTKVNNTWLAPKPLKEGINTATNDACVGLSADGQILFLFKPSEDQRTGDLYESRMGLDDWETPFKLGSNINSEYNETSACITLDDKVLYFSSDRPGGFGGKDIYKVMRLPNGKWSKAMNLGPTVNTAYDEDAPFIHTDKKTLYFSSKGHQNMGGYDVFKTIYEKRVWSTPENLKAPINTVQDDIFFVLSASGKVGYYSSSREGGFGGQDIYKVVLKDEFVKHHVLKAVVKSKKGKAPLSAKITLIENESKKVIGIYKSNNNTGKFIMLVDPGKSYNIIVESGDYHSYTAELEFDVNNDERFEFNLDKKNGSDK